MLRCSFGGMDPKYTFTPPISMALKRHTSKLEECTSSKEFWALLAKEALQGVGYVVPSLDADKAFFNAIRARVVCAKTYKPAKEMESALCMFFDVSLLSDSSLGSSSTLKRWEEQLTEVVLISN